MKQLLICTRSKGKFPEIVDVLKDLPFSFLNLNDVSAIPPDFDVKETGKTFSENAILKAETLGSMTGLLALADDSGLEVDALDGRPGVYSHRYATGTDTDRCRKLLDEMKDVPPEKRGAQFRCVFALFDPQKEKIATTEGIMRGTIAFESRGRYGFGYDPIFINETGKTNAELSTKEKNAISHRGKALQEMKKVLVYDTRCG